MLVGLVIMRCAPDAGAKTAGGERKHREYLLAGDSPLALGKCVTVYDLITVKRFIWSFSRPCSANGTSAYGVVLPYWLSGVGFVLISTHTGGRRHYRRVNFPD